MKKTVNRRGFIGIGAAFAVAVIVGERLVAHWCNGNIKVVKSLWRNVFHPNALATSRGFHTHLVARMEYSVQVVILAIFGVFVGKRLFQCAINIKINLCIIEHGGIIFARGSEDYCIVGGIGVEITIEAQDAFRIANAAERIIFFAGGKHQHCDKQSVYYCLHFLLKFIS